MAGYPHFGHWGGLATSKGLEGDLATPNGLKKVAKTTIKVLWGGSATSCSRSEGGQKSRWFRPPPLAKMEWSSHPIIFTFFFLGFIF
jgi:hypothetical protein